MHSVFDSDPPLASTGSGKQREENKVILNKMAACRGVMAEQQIPRCAPWPTLAANARG